MRVLPYFNRIPPAQDIRILFSLYLWGNSRPVVRLTMGQLLRSIFPFERLYIASPSRHTLYISLSWNLKFPSPLVRSSISNDSYLGDSRHGRPPVPPPSSTFRALKGAKPPPSSTYRALKGLKRVIFSLCTMYYGAPLLRVPLPTSTCT